MGETSFEIGEPLAIETQFGTLIIRYLLASGREGIVAASVGSFGNPVLVRTQSSCLFSESFLSPDCDCAAQLHESLRMITVEHGLLIYLYEEGRGAGLRVKIDAMRLQSTLQCDTATAYGHLGLSADPRDHLASAFAISKIIGHDYPVELLTNNPNKINLLKDAGIKIVSRRPIICPTNEKVVNYLAEKKRVLGHLIDND